MKLAIKSLVAALCLSALSTGASAEKISFLKQNEPSNLGLFVWVSEDCPFNENMAIQRVVREFKRADLTATENLNFNLTVNVDCMTITNESDKPLGVTTYIETRWGTQTNQGFNVLYEEPNYGTYMISSSDQPNSHYMSKIAESVQDALKDYREVNFP